jgi:hypothetical protein
MEAVCTAALISAHMPVNRCHRICRAGVPLDLHRRQVLAWPYGAGEVGLVGWTYPTQRDYKIRHLLDVSG